MSPQTAPHTPSDGRKGMFCSLVGRAHGHIAKVRFEFDVERRAPVRRAGSRLSMHVHSPASSSAVTGSRRAPLVWLHTPRRSTLLLGRRRPPMQCPPPAPTPTPTPTPGRTTAEAGPSLGAAVQQLILLMCPRNVF